MKRISIFFLTLLVGLLFVSCEKDLTDAGDEPKPSKHHKHLIALQISEEPLSLSEKRMAKGAKREKLYAVNVFAKKKSAKSYSKYAYGLFTDPSKIALEVTEGNLYRFECLIVTNSEDTIYHDNNTYLAPFLHGSKHSPTPADNTFKFSTSENLSDIALGKTNIAANKTTLYPRLIKSYGLLEDFDPSITQAINLATRRAVFGLHFIITPPSEGRLDVTFLSDTLRIAAGNEKYDKQTIYSFNKVDKASQESYEGAIKIHLAWHKADGTVKEYDKSVVLKRKVITTLNIEIKAPTPSPINLTEEGDEMTTERIDWLIE